MLEKRYREPSVGYRKKENLRVQQIEDCCRITPHCIDKDKGPSKKKQLLSRLIHSKEVSFLSTEENSWPFPSALVFISLSTLWAVKGMAFIKHFQCKQRSKCNRTEAKQQQRHTMKLSNRYFKIIIHFMTCSAKDESTWSNRDKDCPMWMCHILARFLNHQFMGLSSSTIVKTFQNYWPTTLVTVAGLQV